MYVPHPLCHIPCSKIPRHTENKTWKTLEPSMLPMTAASQGRGTSHPSLIISSFTDFLLLLWYTRGYWLTRPWSKSTQGTPHRPNGTEEQSQTPAHVQQHRSLDELVLVHLGRVGRVELEVLQDLSAFFGPVLDALEPPGVRPPVSVGFAYARQRRQTMTRQTGVRQMQAGSHK